MRKFPYITVGKILDELAQEGLPLSRVTFLRLVKRLSLPEGQRTSGERKWRVYTPTESNEIKSKIKEEFNFVTA